MIFLTSLLILLVIYIFLFLCAMNIKRIGSISRKSPEMKLEYKRGIDDEYASGVAGAYLFCICYHIFIAVVTIGSASFGAYFIPCLIIAILYILAITYENLKYE